jgi:hypothetical protein
VSRRAINRSAQHLVLRAGHRRAVLAPLLTIPASAAARSRFVVRPLPASATVLLLAKLPRLRVLTSGRFQWQVPGRASGLVHLRPHLKPGARLAKVPGHQRPNNSFKPTPLRGILAPADCQVIIGFGKPAQRRGLTQALAPMPDIEVNRELGDRVFELTDYFTVWWDLSAKDNESTHRPVVETYGNYFSTIIHALLQCFAVVAYQLFETRKDTHSIPKLMRELEERGAYAGSVLRQEIDSNRSTLSKVFALRNKVFAHRVSAESPQLVFSKAGITPNEMKQIVELAQRAVGELVEANGGIKNEHFLSRCKHRESLAQEQSQAVIRKLNANGR